MHEEMQQAFHHGPAALVKIQTKLGRDGVAERELAGSQDTTSKLAQADGAQGKLADGEEPTSKLSDGDNAPGNHGAVSDDLERNMQEGKAEQGQSRPVLPSALDGRILVAECPHKKRL